jgi:hypothetical protein
MVDHNSAAMGFRKMRLNAVGRLLIGVALVLSFIASTMGVRGASVVSAQADAEEGAGSDAIVATAAVEPISLDTSDPHKFIYGGKDTYLIGIYPQIAAVTNGDTDHEYDYVTFLDTLASHGANFFRSMFAMGPDRRSSWPLGRYTLTPWERTGPGTTNDDGLKFDLYKYNEANFVQWDDILSEANSRGIIAQMTIFDCWSIKKTDHYGWGWDYNPFNGDNNVNGIDATDNNGVGNDGFTDLSRTDVIDAQKALIREVVDRYSPVYDNLIYEIANENYYSREWELHLADYLKDYEQSQGYPSHLVMPRDLPNHDFDTGSNPYGGRIKTYDPYEINDGMEVLWPLDQPLISDSDGLEHDLPAIPFEEWYWAAFTSGGFADYLTPDLTSQPNGSSLATQFERLSYLSDFVDQTDYANLTPDDSLVVSGDGFLLYNQANQYVVYTPSGDDFTLDLSGAGAGATLTARWFDPRTGAFGNEFQVSGGGNVAFDPPQSQDWGLLITGDSPTFTDVPFDHPYYDYIEVLYQDGYVAGCNADPLMYCPERIMNRAESSVFVERGIHGAEYDPPDPTVVVFDDVALDAWYADWVHGLWDDGYTAGCGTNPLIYCPDQEHTRAEGCVFYLRMMYGADYEPGAAKGYFVDVDSEMWYAKWVDAAWEAGIAEACETEPELRFCPEEGLTRAVAAYMMVQAKEILLP